MSKLLIIHPTNGGGGGVRDGLFQNLNGGEIFYQYQTVEILNEKELMELVEKGVENPEVDGIGLLLTSWDFISDPRLKPMLERVISMVEHGSSRIIFLFGLLWLDGQNLDNFPHQMMTEWRRAEIQSLDFIDQLKKVLHHCAFRFRGR